MSAALPPPSEIEARIARARLSEGTRPCVDRLRFATFAELLEARGAHGTNPFLVYYDEAGHRSAFSYGEFAARVAARAHTLAQAGVARGDRVATLMHNHPEAPVTCFAAWRLGATVVPVNMGEDDARIEFVLENSAAKVIVLLPEYGARARSLRAGREGRRVLDLAALSEGAPSQGALAALPLPEPEDDALIVYTSGTTGPPKGVVLSQQNLLVDAEAIAGWHALHEGSRLGCVLPVHHVNGLVVTLVTPCVAGGSVVLWRRFRTQDFWPIVKGEGVEVVSVVPTLLAFLLEDEEEAHRADLGRLRHLICGAGPLTVDLARRFEERFARRIVHGYGLSETTCYSCFLPLDLSDEEHAHWMRDFGFPSIGVPLPPNEMAIHNSEGRPLGPGERGEIVLRGVNVMKGYHGRPDANAHSFAFGWFRSGDEGFFERDPRGRPFFFITGRLKELIIRGGVNLSPFEIDEILSRIPGVARGLAVGFENDWYGEEVGAYVKLEPGAPLDEGAILEACRQRLPFAKAPKVVVFGEDIPVTSTGKYQRGRLRHLFAAHKSTQFRERR
ncbi:MAG TPA: long-chain fatty acid--CoA ligase [Deltaproteobacteria bacterium]|nr:long-chain fatty acid--CoA ligase [Deltaproteobacteria bacterium]